MATAKKTTYTAAQLIERLHAVDTTIPTLYLVEASGSKKDALIHPEIVPYQGRYYPGVYEDRKYADITRKMLVGDQPRHRAHQPGGQHSLGTPTLEEFNVSELRKEAEAIGVLRMGGDYSYVHRGFYGYDFHLTHSKLIFCHEDPTPYLKKLPERVRAYVVRLEDVELPVPAPVAKKLKKGKPAVAPAVEEDPLAELRRLRVEHRLDIDRVEEKVARIHRLERLLKDVAPESQLG